LALDFFINVPVSVIGIFLVSAYIFDPPYVHRTSSRIDYWGMGLLAIGIATLQVVFDKGQEDDWFGSHSIVAMTTIAVIGLVSFTVWEMHFRDAVVHFQLTCLEYCAAPAPDRLLQSFCRRVRAK
jgi:MFS transporter, DHA2 family, multidrug resistance protein